LQSLSLKELCRQVSKKLVVPEVDMAELGERSQRRRERAVEFPLRDADGHNILVLASDPIP